MVRKANIVQKQELGGGKGCAEVHEIVPEKDLYGHGKLYAKVVLKPNSSVGWHCRPDYPALQPCLPRLRCKSSVRRSLL